MGSFLLHLVQFVYPALGTPPQPPKLHVLSSLGTHRIPFSKIHRVNGLVTNATLAFCSDTLFHIDSFILVFPANGLGTLRGSDDIFTL